MKLKFEFKTLLFNRGPYVKEFFWRKCENRNLYPGEIQFTTAMTLKQLNVRGGWTFYEPKKL